MVWLGVAKTDPPRKNRSPDQILPVRSTCRTADEPHSILISSDSAPSGTDAVFGTLTALAGKCIQKYQTAMTKATTINGSLRKAANLSQEGSPGRTMVDGSKGGGVALSPIRDSAPRAARPPTQLPHPQCDRGRQRAPHRCLLQGHSPETAARIARTV